MLHLFSFNLLLLRTAHEDRCQHTERCGLNESSLRIPWAWSQISHGWVVLGAQCPRLLRSYNYCVSGSLAKMEGSHAGVREGKRLGGGELMGRDEWGEVGRVTLVI